MNYTASSGPASATLRKRKESFSCRNLQSLLMSWYGSCQFLTHVVLRTLLFSGSLVHNLQMNVSGYYLLKSGTAFVS